ncbi:MAG: 3-deoxy-7-phosphoheptulonate synthase [Acidobacteria bacterium]|nr:MAG: 3-deoxy-7-phosphoheptulonate synthase [Acidobacteriota bacterium]
MLVRVCPGADPDAVRHSLEALGLWVTRYDERGGETVLFRVGPHSRRVEPEAVRRLPGVAGIAEPPSPHPLVDRHPASVEVGGVPIGAGAPPVLMAGPCAVESPEQIDRAAARVAAAGAAFLRGGAFKPRSSPYSFEGWGTRALGWLSEAARRHGLRVVTEALSEADVDAVAEHADLVQIGSRNMQNMALLRRAASCGRPILLKRGMAAGIRDWLLAAEHLLAHGAPAVVFCERGIRGFDESTRNLLDLGAVALLAEVHRLPVVVDPSHALGRRDLIRPLARAALAAGAHGLLVETHDAPEGALSDAPQALPPEEFAALASEVTASGRAGAAR